MQSSQEHLKTTVYAILRGGGEEANRVYYGGFENKEQGLEQQKVDSGPVHMYPHILENRFFFSF